jgi:hypothetical protein
MMAKESMSRRAADNAYLHKDFHGALSTGIAFLESRYGAEEVREYVRLFARRFYAPLIREIHEKGLSALRDHLVRIYAVEGAAISITFSADTLLLEVPLCPAVTYMRGHGYSVAPLFFETSRTLYEALCEGSPFTSEWLEYDPETGRTRVRFSRRSA